MTEPLPASLFPAQDSRNTYWRPRPENRWPLPEPITIEVLTWHRWLTGNFEQPCECLAGFLKKSARISYCPGGGMDYEVITRLAKSACQQHRWRVLHGEQLFSPEQLFDDLYLDQSKFEKNYEGFFEYCLCKLAEWHLELVSGDS